MRCCVLGKKYAIFFIAPSQAEASAMAKTFLEIEESLGDHIGFIPGIGWLKGTTLEPLQKALSKIETGGFSRK